MNSELELAGFRYSTFADQVLAPAIYPFSTPLNAAAFQCAARISHDEAVRQKYEPVELGWRWGPAWSTAWFHLTGRLPAEMDGKPAALRFSSGTEALLWRAGEPEQGFDVNHEAWLLPDDVRTGRSTDLFIEAACNRLFGVTTFWWDEKETRRRWREPKPGQLTLCEIATYEPVVWRLWRTFDFARRLMLLTPEDDRRAWRLCEGLRNALVTIDDRNVGGSAGEALAILEKALSNGGAATGAPCFAVGHAHIDTAWLWPIRETKRKCLRTFSTALRLMEQFPDYCFIHTQPQHYAWLETESPELFARILERIREGRWEAGGASWIEPDCNIPSGESLVRQILQGLRYCCEKFGDRAAPPYLFLPDSFGFATTLPQIMKLAGLETFITNKLWWSDANEFPHVNFLWKGLDGTTVRAHVTPGQDYNCTATPEEWRRGDSKAARLGKANGTPWLQPYGYGDGGGGPTAETVLSAELAGLADGMPNVRHGRVREFCVEFAREHAAARDAGREWPIWDGELYLEYHRGVYTTCAWIKRANRRAEDGLRLAELLAFAAPKAPTQAEKSLAAKKLDDTWKLLLLNQFHDVLPGASIAEAYEDARRHFETINESYDELIDAGLRRWAEQMDATGADQPIAVFNPSAFIRSGLIECDGRTHYVADVPALGVAVVDRASSANIEPACVNDRTLSNGLVEATIDEAGRVSRFVHSGMKREAGAMDATGSRAPLNQLVLYEDRPRAWEAWDIDVEYEEKAFPINDPAENWSIVENGPLRAAIEISRPLGRHSRITQRYVLEAGSPRLDIQTRVDWRESRRMLRALFPVDVRSRRATYDVSFGVVERPTHQSTPRERAMFEVCAHRWMNLSEPGFGVALLNDCKYGHSCRGHVMGLTLLRSTQYPSPNIDTGEHEFTYSLMPHAGDWRAAGVDRQAEALNVPLRAVALAQNQRGPLGDRWSPLDIHADGAANVVVSAVKQAEDDDRLIVRLVETHGGAGQATINWRLPVSAVECVDLLESPTPNADLEHETSTRRTTIALHPYQIVTLAAKLET